MVYQKDVYERVPRPLSYLKFEKINKNEKRDNRALVVKPDIWCSWKLVQKIFQGGKLTTWSSAASKSRNIKT